MATRARDHLTAAQASGPSLAGFELAALVEFAAEFLRDAPGRRGDPHVVVEVVFARMLSPS